MAMLFTREFESYGVKFLVKMLSTREAMALENIEEEQMFNVVCDIVLNEDKTRMFQSADAVKDNLPPAVIEDIVLMSSGQEKKKEQ